VEESEDVFQEGVGFTEECDIGEGSRKVVNVYISTSCYSFYLTLKTAKLIVI
jgi:hypothetical protein